jgi:hypothetical protein
MPRGRQVVRTLGSWSRAVLELARVVFAVHRDASRGFACCLEGRHGRAPASGAECRAARMRWVVARCGLAVRARPTRQREARRGLTSSSWRDSHSSSKATASQRRAPPPHHPAGRYHHCIFPLRGNSTKQPSAVSSSSRRWARAMESLRPLLFMLRPGLTAK